MILTQLLLIFLHFLHFLIVVPEFPFCLCEILSELHQLCGECGGDVLNLSVLLLQHGLLLVKNPRHLQSLMEDPCNAPLVLNVSIMTPPTQPSIDGSFDSQTITATYP